MQERLATLLDQGQRDNTSCAGGSLPLVYKIYE
jgi:hypothetical protein